MAMRASVTVSIAELNSGMFIAISRVTRVRVSAVDGSTLDGWHPAARGSWGEERDAEGGYVLQGRATADGWRPWQQCGGQLETSGSRSDVPRRRPRTPRAPT